MNTYGSQFYHIFYFDIMTDFDIIFVWPLIGPQGVILDYITIPAGGHPSRYIIFVQKKDIREILRLKKRCPTLRYWTSTGVLCDTSTALVKPYVLSIMLNHSLSIRPTAGNLGSFRREELLMSNLQQQECVSMHK